LHISGLVGDQSAANTGDMQVVAASRVAKKFKRGMT